MAAVGASGPAAAGGVVTAAAEQAAIEAANGGTVGLYFVREHVQQALPAVLQARSGLQQTAAAAADATYAANHSREFAGTLRTALPASLLRLEAGLRDASWTAGEVTRRHKERHGGGGGSLLGSFVPTRLRGLWPGGSSETSGSEGMYS